MKSILSKISSLALIRIQDQLLLISFLLTALIFISYKMERGIFLDPSRSLNQSLYPNSLFEELAELHLSQHRHEEALEFYCLITRKQMSGDTKKPTKNTEKLLLHIAEQFKSQSKYAESLKAYHEVLRLIRYRSGKSDVQVFEIYRDIASIYKEKGDYEKSLESLVRTIEIAEKTQLNDNIIIKELYFKAGEICKLRGDWKNVIKYYEKANVLSVNDECESPSMKAQCLSSLGLAYYQEKDHAKAYECLQEVVEIFPKLSREENFLFVENLTQNLGHICMIRRQYESALNQYKVLLETKMKRLGLCHRDIVPAFLHIGEAYLKLERYMDAMRYYKQSLKMTIKTRGKQDLFIAEVYNSIAMIYRKHRNWKKSLKYYLRALEVMKKDLRKNGEQGDCHEKRVNLYKNIGKVFYELGDYDGCIKFLSKGLKIERDAIGLENSKNIGLYTKVASLYELQGKYNKAFGYLIQGFALQKKLFGYNHLCTQATLCKLEIIREKSKGVF